MVELITACTGTTAQPAAITSLESSYDAEISGLISAPGVGIDASNEESPGQPTTSIVIT